MTRYAFSVSVPDTHTATIERVTALLAAQGFGVLTRIDVHEVFQKKLGLTRAHVTDLPALAHIMGEVRTRMQAVVSGLSTET